MRIFRKLHYTIPFLFCLLLPFTLHAQQVSIHHPQLRFLLEDSLLQNPFYHSALLPLKVSVEQFNQEFKPKELHNPAKNFFISPVIDAVAGYQYQNKDFSYRFGQGAYFAGNLGKKAGFELSAVLYEQKFPGENYSIDSLQLVPRHNRYLWGKNEQTGYLSIRGNVYWNVNRWLTFTAGNDKHFIGDGQQSLLLSENAAAYPFFQTQLKVWKVQYQHQVMFMRDLLYGEASTRFTKYSSQHVLSYNITPRLNMYIFESVIWRKQDSTRLRGFDLTYLNPFIFFRPVEFNQGSPDNVLMGIGGKYRVFGRSFLCGQFLLDEFNLKEIKANKDWWANKYGYQVGFKSYGLFNNKPSFFSLEYNQMRPFTYSHSYSLQNYGYLKEPLAHPLGSNFKDISGVLRVAVSDNWFIHGKGSFLRYGTDPGRFNYGADIYKQQWTFTKKYDNYITQGILNSVLSGEVTVSRMLVPSWRLTAFSTLNLTIHKTGDVQEFFSTFQLGLNTLIYE